LILERLEVRNFEGYRHAEVSFAKGLNIITGRNSTGKTTLLEALLFALYGGVEKRLLVSRLQGAGGAMSVKLAMDVNGRKVEIFREGRLVGAEPRKFRTERLSLKVDGSEVPVHGEEELNRKIGELLSMGVKTFTSLVYARQGELTSVLEPRREDMDLLLGITLMKELAEQLDAARKTLEKHEGKDAKTMLEMYAKQLPSLLSQIDRLTGQTGRLEAEVHDLEEVVGKAKSKELESLLRLIGQRDALAEKIRQNENLLTSLLAEKGAKTVEELVKLAEEAARKEGEVRLEVQQLEEEEKRLSEALNELEAKLGRIEVYLKSAEVSTVEELEKKASSAEEEYARLGEQAERLKVELNAVTDERNKLKGRVSALQEEVESHKRLLEEGATNCPTCGQDVSPVILEQIIEDKSYTLKDLTQKLGEVDEKYGALSREFEELRSTLAELTSRVANLRRTCGEVNAILAGKTVKELEDERDKLQKDLDGLRYTVKEVTEQHAKLMAEAQSLQDATAKVMRLQRETSDLKQKLSRCLSEAKDALQALGLSFSPEDADLRAKVAEQLPLSVEELARRERSLQEKREQLQKLKAELEALRKEEQDVKAKVAELQRRLGRAKVCEKLLEKIRGGVESVRERKLKRIADEALRVYEALTDQRVYKAFRVNPESYAVEVFPSRLEGYIPAKRTGGGHQTLIALAFRIALLNVLNQRSLLILDEPTYGVDSENLPQLMSFFSEAAKKFGQTILVTHYGLGEEEAANVIRVELAPDGSSTAQQAR